MKVSTLSSLAACLLLAIGLGHHDHVHATYKHKKPAPPSSQKQSQGQGQHQGQGQSQGQGQTSNNKNHNSNKASSASNSKSRSNAASNSRSNATGGNATGGNSKSRSSATGGAGGNASATTGNNRNSLGQSASNEATNEGNSTEVGGDSIKSLNIQLPPPVMAAAIPQATAACTTSQSRAFAVGFNFVSWGSSDQIINNLCMAERQAAVFESQCKYRSAIATRYWVATRAVRAGVAMQSMDSSVDGEMYGGVPVQALANPGNADLATFLQDIGQGAAQPWAGERNYTINECINGAEPVLETQAPATLIQRFDSSTYERAMEGREPLR